jgi:acyl-CoA thioesterase
MNQIMNPAEQLLANDPASKMLGICLINKTEDSCQLVMPIRRDMTNGYNICHGGFIFTLADTASAFAAAKNQMVIVTSNNQIDYLAPAHLNDTITAFAKVNQVSGRSLFCDVELFNQEKKLIALMRSKLIQKT